jgi:hypothetical protein
MNGLVYRYTWPKKLFIELYLIVVSTVPIYILMYYWSWLQWIFEKKYTTEHVVCINEANYRTYTNQQSRLHRWSELQTMYNPAKSFESIRRRPSRCLEIVPNVSGYSARFTSSSLGYIQTDRSFHDIEKFIFSILQKQKQNVLKTSQNKRVWTK